MNDDKKNLACSSFLLSLLRGIFAGANFPDNLKNIS